MLIVSSGNLWLLLPALVAFGIGVFIVLLLFAYLFSIFRDQMATRFNRVTEYAPLVSGLFLLFFSILQM
jgi:cytochrome c biogenesis protein CcdA